LAKREIISIQSAWWVWLVEGKAIRVATEEEAAKLLRDHGAEYTGLKESHRELANAVREVLWNEPLPEGQTFHKTIFDPLKMLLYKGQARKILPRMSPSRLKRVPPEWADLYRAADADSDVLSIKSGIPLVKQLEARWPTQDA
jgi:hypothetical protein